jgi:hypothetical protein
VGLRWLEPIHTEKMVHYFTVLSVGLWLVCGLLPNNFGIGVNRLKGERQREREKEEVSFTLAAVVSTTAMRLSR